MAVCFICYEERDTAECRQVCTTCVGSTICRVCESTVRDNEAYHDALTNCPICRVRVVGENLEPTLSSMWHSLTLLSWWWVGAGVGVWQQLTVLFISQRYLSYVCRMANRTRENGRPSLLIRRWNTTCLVIHAPYVIYQLSVGKGKPTDHYFNSYALFHVLCPLLLRITFVGILGIHGFIRRRYPPTITTGV